MNNKRLGLHYAWWIMIASAAIYAASVGIIVSNAGLLYNVVSEDLGVGIGDISLYTTIMYLTITVLLPFSSRILKRFSLRTVLTVSGIMNALAFGLMGIYSSVFQFYISGFFLGIGSTFLIYGTIPLIINNWFKVKMGTALGAAMAFMGMNMAQNVTGMNAQNLFQMEHQQAVHQPMQQEVVKPIKQEETGWTCSCGAVNKGKFCIECGSKKPEPVQGWTCSCGAVNKGKFCPECGAKKPAGVPQYKCDKCGWEPEKGIKPPKFCPECGDPFDDGDIVG